MSAWNATHRIIVATLCHDDDRIARTITSTCVHSAPQSCMRRTSSASREKSEERMLGLMIVSGRSRVAIRCYSVRFERSFVRVSEPAQAATSSFHRPLSVVRATPVVMRVPPGLGEGAPRDDLKCLARALPV